MGKLIWDVDHLAVSHVSISTMMKSWDRTRKVLVRCSEAGVPWSHTRNVLRLGFPYWLLTVHCLLQRYWLPCQEQTLGPTSLSKLAANMLPCSTSVQHRCLINSLICWSALIASARRAAATALVLRSFPCLVTSQQFKRSVWIGTVWEEWRNWET